jgi:hypothetical protein
MLEIIKKITFLDGLLIFIFLNLIIIFVYQSLYEKCLTNPHTNVCKTLGLSQNLNITNNLNKNAFNSFNSLSVKNNKKKENLIGKNNKLRLLMNDKGPEIGFHQYFKPHLPELGWKDFYLRLNGGISQVEQLNPRNGKSGSTIFNNIVTRNYLDQLESTDNVYASVNY